MVVTINLVTTIFLLKIEGMRILFLLNKPIHFAIYPEINGFLFVFKDVY